MIQIQMFLEASFLTRFKMFHLIRRESVICLDVPKLLSAQLTRCPAIPLFFLPSGLSGTSISQDPQSHLAVNKGGLVPISCTPGKHRATSCWGQSVAHIMALSFPQHQPSISTLWLCHKSPSAALHAKRGRLQQQTPTAAAARATPQHPLHQH